MKALNRMLYIEASTWKLGIGVRISSRDFKILFLVFANDWLLLYKANSDCCNKLKSVLDKFCLILGKLINYQNSIMTFSRNASSIHKQLVTAIFNIPQRESLGKYLGCSIFQWRTSSSTFQEIINKANTKLEGWKANCLSKAGRTVLIQSHLESLSAHIMQMPWTTLKD